MIKNLIFDWSGVVNDNILATCEAINYVLGAHAVRYMTVEEIKATWIQPYMLFYRKFIPDLGIEKEKDLFYLGYKNAVQKNPPCAFPGMVDCVKLFKEADLKLIIISSDHTDILLNEIDEYGLNGIFDEIYSDVHDKRLGLKEILEKNNFLPNETVFIGDSTHEIESGKSMGIMTCAISWGLQNADRLLAERPDFFASTVDEFKKIILERHAPSEHILGVRVSALSKELALKIVNNYLKSNYQYSIFTPNPEMVVKAQRDEYFCKILNFGSLNLCDGFGLWLAIKLKKKKEKRKIMTERIAGVDFMLDLCALAEQENKSIYLLGSGSDEVIKKTAENLQKQFPKLKIVGYNSGPEILEAENGLVCHSRENGNPEHRQKLDSLFQGNDKLVEYIQAVKPSILFVAFGMGKQEKWIYENLAKMPSVRIAMGVGGAFDYISGLIPRAPLLLRKIGLEWVYRLWKQPRRIGRIFNATVKFVVSYVRSRTTKRKRQK